MKAKHKHKSSIQIRVGFFLDPNPAVHGHRNPFQTYDAAKRELQSAIGKPVTMASLRDLLPPTTNSSTLSDDDIIDQIAQMVKRGDASLKFTTTDAGDLPWPDILKDLGKPDFEGTVNHLYLDSFGKVTVGVGTMLASVNEAQDLGFVVRKTGKAATAAEISADYTKVSGQKANLRADKYDTDLDLPQSEIDRVLKVRAEKSADQVAARYKGWDGYPVEVKRALIDMRYNMNANMDKFVSFQTAIEKAAQTKTGNDWQTAADASHRAAPVSETRNKWTSDMILKGGGVIK